MGKYLEGKRKTREALYQTKRQAKRNKFLATLVKLFEPHVTDQEMVYPKLWVKALD